MKRLLSITLILALLLGLSACGGTTSTTPGTEDPGTSAEIPETPETPETPDVPEVPETPETPETPAVPEISAPPEGAVIQVVNGSEVGYATKLKELTPLIKSTGLSQVTLLADFQAEENIIFPYTCSIDLNGHKISTVNAGNAIMIWAEGKESRHTVIKNGTVDGYSLGIRVNAGSIEVDGVTVLSHNAPAVGMYGTDFVEGEVNVIRNCTIYTDLSGAFSWHQNEGSQAGRNILIENTNLVVTNDKGLLFRTRNSGASVTLGENVNLFSYGPDAYTDGVVKMAGKTPVSVGTAATEVLGTSLPDMKCWTTGDPAAFGGSATGSTEPGAKTDDPVLLARRDAAEAYMRKMATILWRADADLLYTITGDTKPEYADSSKQFNIVAGRIYSGIPYSYSGATAASWLDLAGEPDAKGVYTISGLTWQAMSGLSTDARLGNDCSSSVERAWQSLGSAIPLKSTNVMTPDNGFIHVGNYEAPKDILSDTKADCQKNGEQTIYEAYALAQKADAVVCRSATGGHAMMVVSNRVVRKADGTIDGYASKITIMDQEGGSFKKGEKVYNEALGQDVYITLRQDVSYRYRDLFDDGYLPITCKELIDPAPIAAASVSDSIAMPKAETLFTGTISSNRALDGVTVTITDGSGKVVQECLARPIRSTVFGFYMSQFVSDSAEQLKGSVDLSKLSAGKYRCTVTARTITGETVTVRDFEFTGPVTVSTEAPEIPAEPTTPTEIPAGAVAEITTGGAVTYVMSLSELGTVVNPSGKSKVKLLADVIDFPGSVRPKYTCEFDLNGHTITTTAGRAIWVEKVGSENRNTIIKNGTLKGYSLGVEIKGGTLEMENVTCIGKTEKAVAIFATDLVEGEVNVIRNCVLSTPDSGAFAWHATSGNSQAGKNILIENTTLVMTHQAGNVFRDRNGGAKVTLGKGVTVYTANDSSVYEDRLTMAGETLTAAGTGDVTVAGETIKGLYKWTTPQ